MAAAQHSKSGAWRIFTTLLLSRSALRVRALAERAGVGGSCPVGLPAQNVVKDPWCTHSPLCTAYVRIHRTVAGWCYLYSLHISRAHALLNLLSDHLDQLGKGRKESAGARGFCCDARSRVRSAARRVSRAKGLFLEKGTLQQCLEEEARGTPRALGALLQA